MSRESADPTGLNPNGEELNEHSSLAFLSDVTMEVVAEFGSTEVAIRNILGWKIGDIVVLDQNEGQPMQIRANGRAVGSGEAVVVNDHYGVRVTAIRDPELE